MIVLQCATLTLLCFSSSVCGQMCREYGETCSDDDSCCGGCCLGGICMATYQDCRIKEDLCLEKYCPPSQECYVFIPEGCLGCGPVAMCRSVFTSGEFHLPSTENFDHSMWHSSSGRPVHEKIVIFITLFVLCRL
ncbi:unnamed protein product [Acanthoscelides obtectus]|uniref:Uncharacterized protein n=1 Tax=Acanthoscelides obtectus TaxID=200917 RepID=A0A9P0LGS9_ACAOB|nr:unnamed protein product [Acanthoscelides obtectus]CAK1663582.1 hypothetical protein AOBTE_LOCUS23740 [Acanthoscelides obtectus]